MEEFERVNDDGRAKAIRLEREDVERRGGITVLYRAEWCLCGPVAGGFEGSMISFLSLSQLSLPNGKFAFLGTASWAPGLWRKPPVSVGAGRSGADRRLFGGGGIAFVWQKHCQPRVHDRLRRRRQRLHRPEPKRGDQPPWAKTRDLARARPGRE